MCTVPPLHLQWWKPVTSTAEPFTILSLLKEQGSILKLCWEGKEKKKNWGAGIQWQGIQPCKDVMKGELLPLFLNSTIQSFQSNKITPLAIMGDDFCTGLLQCKAWGNGPCVCFPGAPGGTWDVVYELPFWSYRCTRGRGCAQPPCPQAGVHRTGLWATEAIHSQRARRFTPHMEDLVWSFFPPCSPWYKEILSFLGRQVSKFSSNFSIHFQV